MLAVPWRVLPYGLWTARENMAMDEAVFRVRQRSQMPPTLRFYSWRSPAVSVGYFQDIEKEIDHAFCAGENLDIVRRPTGGKAVLHEDDLTYSVISGEGDPLFPPDVLGTYRVVSRCLTRGFAEIGLGVRMALGGRNGRGDASCFASPSRYELLVGERKICGSAQVRSRGSFLQHGSILLDFAPEKNAAFLKTADGDRQKLVKSLRASVTSLREELGTAADPAELGALFQRAFSVALGVDLQPGALSSEEERLMARLLTTKYSDPMWNLKGRVSRDGLESVDPAGNPGAKGL